MFFFADQESDFNISKKNFPENTLVNVNQGTRRIDNLYQLLCMGQIVPAQNSPKDINAYN